MDLILQVRTGRNRAILTCSGQLMGGKEADAFRRSAMLLLGGFDQLTINLEGLRSADLRGLSDLASVVETAEKQGKQVRITHASHWMIAMLETIGLTRSLRSFHNSMGDAARPALKTPEEAIA